MVRQWSTLIGSGNELALALGETDFSLTRFDRFARKVLGQDSSLIARLRLHGQLHQVILQGLGDLLAGDRPGWCSRALGG